MKRALSILICVVAVATLLPAILLLYAGVLGYPVDKNQSASAFFLVVLGAAVIVPLSAARSLTQ